MALLFQYGVSKQRIAGLMAQGNASTESKFLSLFRGLQYFFCQPRTSA